MCVRAAVLLLCRIVANFYSFNAFLVLVSDPNNLSTVVKLGSMYLDMGRTKQSLPFIEKSMKLFTDSQISASQGMEIVELGFRYWKSCRFVTKDIENLRLNMTVERAKMLVDVTNLLSILTRMHDVPLGNAIAVRMAYAKECVGSFQDSLAILSDLIAAQATDGVDLSFIILKAAGTKLNLLLNCLYV